MNFCAETMGKIEDWLEVIPSKNKRKSYFYGVSVFETWYQTPSLVTTSLIGEKK